MIISREHFNIFADEVTQSSNTAPTCSSLGPIADGKRSFTVATLGKLFFPLTAPYSLSLYPLFTLTETHTCISPWRWTVGGGAGMRPTPFIFFHSFSWLNRQVWPSPASLQPFSPLAASSKSHAMAEGIKIDAVGPLKKPSHDSPGLCPQVKTVSPEENCIYWLVSPCSLLLWHSSHMSLVLLKVSSC